MARLERDSLRKVPYVDNLNRRGTIRILERRNMQIFVPGGCRNATRTRFDKLAELRVGPEALGGFDAIPVVEDQWRVAGRVFGADPVEERAHVRLGECVLYMLRPDLSRC